MLSKIKGYVSKIIKAFVWGGCFFLPINKKKIICCTGMGKGYSDNPKYIAEELRKTDDFEIIWMLNDMSYADTLPTGIIPCKIDSIKAIYHLLTASVWIDSFRKKFRYKKNKTLYIQTWHGGGAGKKSEKDVVDTLDKSYVKMAIKDARNTDIMIAPDLYAVNVYRKSFWFDGPVAAIGYPRCDLFFSDEKEIMRKKVYEFFDIPDEYRIILYAPTFRRDNKDYLSNIDFSRMLNAMKERFGNNYIVLTHLHINVKIQGKDITYDVNKVIDGNSYPDMQELLVAADILISDYSSVAYDFALMKKPVFRFLPDLKAYREDRDMYLKIDEYPYPFAESNEEFVKIIKEFDINAYEEKLDTFMNAIGAIRNSNAARRVFDYINVFTDSGLKKTSIYERYTGDFVF